MTERTPGIGQKSTFMPLCFPLSKCFLRRKGPGTEHQELRALVFLLPIKIQDLLRRESWDCYFGFSMGGLENQEKKKGAGMFARGMLYNVAISVS